jgi:hypothetical protein
MSTDREMTPPGATELKPTNTTLVEDFFALVGRALMAVGRVVGRLLPRRRTTVS